MSDKTKHSATDEEMVAQKGQAETNTDEHNQETSAREDSGDHLNNTGDESSSSHENSDSKEKTDAEDREQKIDETPRTKEASGEDNTDHADSDKSNNNTDSDNTQDEASHEAEEEYAFEKTITIGLKPKKKRTKDNTDDDDIPEAELVEDNEKEQKVKRKSTSKHTQRSSDNHAQKPFADDDEEVLRRAFGEDSRDFMTSIREQIENCKTEIQDSLKQSLREDLRLVAEKQIAKANRRRRWSNFFHDIVIIALIATSVYFGYCLYDVQYFPFMKPQCENGTTDCQAQLDTEMPAPSFEQQSAGPVKDSTWFLANYSYLFENLQTKLSGDNLSAYYLYSDDRRASEIEPEYLLAMAYAHSNTSAMLGTSTITISVEEMQQAFEDTFGTLEFYEPVDFDYDCLHFEFSKNDNLFTAENILCNQAKKREIVEQIEQIYEEGEAIYIVTNAAIFDHKTRQLYSIDNLFRPIAINVDVSDLSLYRTSINRYQYQFKKAANEEKYFFSSITKLQ